MVKQVTTFEDSSGKLHRSEAEAHRAELAIWLAASGEINAASAEKLAERMAANAPMLVDTLTRLTRDIILKAPADIRQIKVAR